MGKPLANRIRPVRGGANRHGEVTAVFVHGFADHLGMAMQPAYAGAVGRVELKFDQNAADREPLLDRG